MHTEIDYVTLWTDSLTAIRCLKGQSKTFRSYVSYRVGEICICICIGRVDEMFEFFIWKLSQGQFSFTVGTRNY